MNFQKILLEKIHQLFIILSLIIFPNIECIHIQLASTDMKIKEFKENCNTVWSTKYNFITKDLTKKKTNGRLQTKFKYSFCTTYKPLLSNLIYIKS